MKYFLRITVLTAAAALLALGGCRQKTPAVPAGARAAVYPEKLAGEPKIRVRVLSTAAAAELTVTGGYKMKVTTLAGQEVDGSGDRAVTIGAGAAASGVKLGKDVYRKAVIIPENQTLLKLRVRDGGKAAEYVLPGAAAFTRDGRGRLQVVAELPVERYLAGVIGGEMFLSFHPEALKSQAVAARTYALYHIKTHAANSYDVESDTSSQVWKPQLAGDARARAAVDSTRGQIMTEGGRLFPTYFCSDCGGVTADGNTVFPGTGGNALSGGVKCGYAANRTKPGDFVFSVSKEEASKRLSAAGMNNGRLLRIELLDAGKNRLSGSVPERAYFVRLFNDNGVERVISATDFRQAMGNTALRSMLVTLRQDGQNLVFSGRGFGHGVGLCQYGADYTAREERKDYRMILEKYYPGAEVVRVW